MKDKKFKRKVIFSVVNLVTVFFVLVFATTAWMSQNRVLTASGMKTSIEVEPNLVVSGKNGTVGEGEKSIFELTKAANDNLTFSWADRAVKLQPATHDWTKGNLTGLIYCNSPENIYRDTGLSANKSDNSDLTFAAVPVYSDDTEAYYIDYCVYVASVMKPYTEITGLYANISELGNTLATETNIAYKSTTVDFYIAKVGKNETVTPTKDNYKGSLNLEDTSKSVNLLNNTDITEVPLNTENSLAILMRCYFDGALTYIDASESPSVTKCYVNSNQIQTNRTKVHFKINISTD